MHKTPVTFISSVFVLIIVLISIAPGKAYCENVNGRITFGGLTSTERFADASGTGSDKNDFQILSSRFFLNVEEINKSALQATLDLRDKYDFFDKLETERLQLGPRNEFQARQVSLKASKADRFWGWQLGRFPILEAGSAFTDGAQVENHWSPSWTSSLFMGLNPKKDDQSYLEYNSDATIRGLTLTYEDKSKGWGKNFYSTQAFVEKATQNFVDRRYFFNSLNYQWEMNSRVITMLYYDFVPRSYIQNGNFAWQQGWSKYFQTEVNALTIDVIEYSRRKGVLETLPSSPYSESSAKFILNLSDQTHRLYLQALQGERSLDHTKRISQELGYINSGIFGSRWDFYTSAGSRRNFTSQDVFTRLGLGFYSRRWEWSLDAQTQIQKNDSGTTTHPLILDSSLSNYFSRNTYLTLSGQYAKDERVTILSLFFRIGYRFGNREIPPLRDGAPPRGPL